MSWISSTWPGAPYSPKRNILLWVYLGTCMPEKSVSATWCFYSCQISQISFIHLSLSIFKLLKLKKRKKPQTKFHRFEKGCCWTDVLDPICLWQWEMPLSCFISCSYCTKPSKGKKERRGSRQALAYPPLEEYCRMFKMWWWTLSPSAHLPSYKEMSQP